MGHYASELGLYDSKKEPIRQARTKDIPYTERERHAEYGPGVYPPTDEGVVEEYALDYDDWDGEFRGRDDTREDHYVKRRIVERIGERRGGWSNTADRILRIFREFAPYRHEGAEDRPAVVYKRTVTYGPWEKVEEIPDAG